MSSAKRRSQEASIEYEAARDFYRRQQKSINSEQKPVAKSDDAVKEQLMNLK